ncbi:hypothetical protein P7C73_g558, partial [Tremellales sp. Uapishka_1]
MGNYGRIADENWPHPPTRAPTLESPASRDLLSEEQPASPEAPQTTVSIPSLAVDRPVERPSLIHAGDSNLTSVDDLSTSSDEASPPESAYPVDIRQTKERTRTRRRVTPEDLPDWPQPFGHGSVRISNMDQLVAQQHDLVLDHIRVDGVGDETANAGEAERAPDADRTGTKSALHIV